MLRPVWFVLLITAGAALTTVYTCITPFAAFAVIAATTYQLALYAVAVSILGGTGAFTLGIIGQVLLVNAVTFVGLCGLGQLVQAAGSLARRRRGQASPARFA